MADFRITPDPKLHLPKSKECDPEDWKSETTSIASSLYKGFMENGRRYQTLRAAEYFSPSDEKQFETYEVGHLACLLMNGDAQNPLYLAPIRSPKHVLDIGTGQGSWAIDVADMFPDAVVRGVDLFPPPVSWIPPNCIFEVDDVLQPWTWRDKFDLIHLRHGIGAFTPEEWAPSINNVMTILNLAAGLSKLKWTFGVNVTMAASLPIVSYLLGALDFLPLGQRWASLLISPNKCAHLLKKLDSLTFMKRLRSGPSGHGQETKH